MKRFDDKDCPEDYDYKDGYMTAAKFFGYSLVGIMILIILSILL